MNQAIATSHTFQVNRYNERCSLLVWSFTSMFSRLQGATMYRNRSPPWSTTETWSDISLANKRFWSPFREWKVYKYFLTTICVLTPCPSCLTSPCKIVAEVLRCWNSRLGNFSFLYSVNRDAWYYYSFVESLTLRKWNICCPMCLKMETARLQNCQSLHELH